MDYTLFKDNLERIISRGKYGRRTVDVAVLKQCKAAIDDNIALRRKLEAIEKVAEWQSKRIETN